MLALLRAIDMLEPAAQGCDVTDAPVSTAAPRKKATLFGCLVAVIAMLAIFYGGIAALGFIWWGPGVIDAIRMHRSTTFFDGPLNVTVFDTVVRQNGGSLSFAPTVWSLARFAGLVSGSLWLAYLLWRRGRATRQVSLILIIVAFLLSIAFRFNAASTARVTVESVTIAKWNGEQTFPRDGNRVAVERYEFGGSAPRSGSTAWSRGWNVVIIGPDDRIIARLVKLPFEDRAVAVQWRNAIAQRSGMATKD